jgi:hypothetical protein
MTDEEYSALKDKIRNDAIAGSVLHAEYIAAVNGGPGSYAWEVFEGAVNIAAWKIAHYRKQTPEAFREDNMESSPYNNIPDYWNTH